LFVVTTRRVISLVRFLIDFTKYLLIVTKIPERPFSRTQFRRTAPRPRSRIFAAEGAAEARG